MTNSTRTGHKTYLLGFPKDLLDCKRITLYYNPSTPVTLSNLEQLYSKGFPGNQSGSSLGGYEKENTTDPYRITIEPGKVLKFDTIIYYSDFSRPIGYTIFDFPQSTEDVGVELLQIYTEFTETYDETSIKSEVFIVNSLVALWTGEVTGTDRLQDSQERALSYTTPGQVKGYIEETPEYNYLKYTNKLGDLISDPSYCLVTDSSFITKDEAYQFWIPEYVEASDYSSTFSKFWTGIYNGDLALYMWDPETWRYKVISLTKTNAFGLSRVLVDMKEVPVEFRDPRFLREPKMSGKVLILEDLGNQESLVVNIETGHVWKSSLQVCSDPWDSSGEIVFLDNSGKFREGTKAYHEHKALPNLPGGLRFIRKVGPWFEYSDYSGSRLYSCPTGTIVFSETEEVLPVTDRCLLVQERGDKDEMIYTFYFVDGVSNEYLWSIGYKREHGLIVYPDSRVISFSAKEVSRDINRRLVIDGLRRCPLETYDLPVDGFISSFSGLLFYKVISPEGEIKIYHL